MICPGVGRGRTSLRCALREFRAAGGWEAAPRSCGSRSGSPSPQGWGGSADAAAVLRLARPPRGSARSEPCSPSRRSSEPMSRRRSSPGAGSRRGPASSCRSSRRPPPFGVLVLPVAVALSTGAVYAEADRLASPATMTSSKGRRRDAGALDGGTPLPAQAGSSTTTCSGPRSRCAPRSPRSGGCARPARAVMVSELGRPCLGCSRPGSRRREGLARAHRAAQALASAPAPLWAVPGAPLRRLPPAGGCRRGPAPGCDGCVRNNLR